jgi:hypothetical protein
VKLSRYFIKKEREKNDSHRNDIRTS